MSKNNPLNFIRNIFYRARNTDINWGCTTVKGRIESLGNKNKSIKGAAQTSFRFYKYYSFTLKDIDIQMIYLKRATSQGNSVSKYNYGLLLTGGYEEYFKYYNSTEAIVWLKIAAHNGNERAKVELENLGKTTL